MRHLINREFFTTMTLFSFPFLRIVKQRASDLKTRANLRIFDCQSKSFAKFS